MKNNIIILIILVSVTFGFSACNTIKYVQEDEHLLTKNTIFVNDKKNVDNEMHQVRVDFVKAMGIKSKEMNPNPIGGYKLEWDVTIRDEHLQEARRLRDCYAKMVKQTGKNQNILDKMDSNLANRDLRAAWK